MLVKHMYSFYLERQSYPKVGEVQWELPLKCFAQTLVSRFKAHILPMQ